MNFLIMYLVGIGIVNIIFLIILREDIRYLKKIREEEIRGK